MDVPDQLGDEEGVSRRFAHDRIDQSLAARGDPGLAEQGVRQRRVSSASSGSTDTSRAASHDGPGCSDAVWTSLRLASACSLEMKE